MGCRPSLTVDVVAPRGRVPGPAARSGLDGLSGEVGRDRYEGWPFSGEARKGDCGYVRELRDLGERMRWSLLRTSWETTREPAALGLLRRLGFFSPSGVPVAGAFSLSENPSWLLLMLAGDMEWLDRLHYLVRRARPAGDAGSTEILVTTLFFVGAGLRKGDVEF